MPSRLAIDTAGLFKLETTYATDSTPVPGSDAMLFKNFECETVMKTVPRDLLRQWFGEDPGLVAYSLIKGKFTVEMGGSGAAGTAPMWGRCLRTSMFAETVSAGVRVDYTPISAALESASLYAYDSGVLKKGLGCRTALAGMRFLHSQRPEIDLDFMALDSGDTAIATPSLTLTPWKAPLAINVANTGLVTIGCTYSAGTLSGGVTYPSKGIEFLGQSTQLVFQELLGGEVVDAAERSPKLRITFDLTAAQEISFMSTLKAGTVQSVGMLHGQAAGAKIGQFYAGAQMTALKREKGEANKRLITCEFDAPFVSGNDEMRIWSM